MAGARVAGPAAPYCGAMRDRAAAQRCSVRLRRRWREEIRNTRAQFGGECLLPPHPITALSFHIAFEMVRPNPSRSDFWRTTVARRWRAVISPDDEDPIARAITT